MKILLDPIYTNDPHLCSMSFKMHKLISYVLERRSDVFFYVVLPAPFFGNEEWDIRDSFLIKSPNVKYISIPTSRDRFVEYYRLDNEWIKKFCFFGEFWDWDYCITARIPMVPSILSFRSKGKSSELFPPIRRVFGVEDMPIVSFKKCVGQFDPRVQDLNTIAGYLSTDCTWVNSFWESTEIRNAARQLFSGTEQLKLMEKLVDASVYEFSGANLKTDEVIGALEKGARKFTLGFTQRFEVVHRGCVKVMKLFETQWIVRSRSMRFIVTSNSRSAKGVPDGRAGESIEFLRLPREEFWRMMKEECDCFVVLSIDDAYPLSLLEPILLGVPCVLLDVKYARSMLGNDYPFYVKNEDEAYAMVREFYMNYRELYGKFRTWVSEKLVPILEKRNKVLLWKIQFERLTSLWESDAESGVKRLESNEVATLLIAATREARIAGKTSFDMFEEIEKLWRAGELRHLTPERNDTFKSLRYMTDWTYYRRALLLNGCRDTNKVGIFEI